MKLAWAPSAFQRRLLTAGLLGVVLAVIVGRPAFAVLAAAPLWLAFAARDRRAHELRATLSIERERCLEGDVVTVTAIVDADAALTLDVFLRTPPGVAIVDGPRRCSVDDRHAEFRWQARPRQWGRRSIGPVIVGAYSPDLREHASARTNDCALTVFPAAERSRHLPLPRALPNRLGDHVSRAVGEGSEFAGIRPFVAGDLARRLNWRATARHGRPYVTQLSAERSSELVIIVDGYSDVVSAGRRSLDASVRGAASLARSYLAEHDRVGVIALGGVLRWVGAKSNGVQFYRIIEALLDIRDFASVVRPSLDRLPRAVLPAGSLVVFFTTLLDERCLEVARDLRERRHPLVIVDVLDAEPRGDTKSAASALALRLWRLERHAMRARLADIGAHILSWDGVEPLDAVLAALPTGGRIA